MGCCELTAFTALSKRLDADLIEQPERVRDREISSGTVVVGIFRSFCSAATSASPPKQSEPTKN